MPVAGSGGYLPSPKKPSKPNNRKPLSSVLPPKPKSNYTFVNAYEKPSTPAAPAAVGQRSGRVDRRPNQTTAWVPLNSFGQPLHKQPNNPLSLYTPSRKRSKPAQMNFYQGFRGLILPLSGFDPTSSFGSRIHPVTKRLSNHTGMDMAAPAGTPIKAAANGMVMGAVRGDSIYGNQVILGHGRNKHTMYGHMLDLAVEEGQEVRQGDIIGYVGSTGMSTGNHLHWETRVRGEAIDPLVIVGGN